MKTYFSRLSKADALLINALVLVSRFNDSVASSMHPLQSPILNLHAALLLNKTAIDDEWVTLSGKNPRFLNCSYFTNTVLIQV